VKTSAELAGSFEAAWNESLSKVNIYRSSAIPSSTTNKCALAMSESVKLTNWAFDLPLSVPLDAACSHQHWLLPIKQHSVLAKSVRADGVIHFCLHFIPRGASQLCGYLCSRWFIRKHEITCSNTFFVNMTIKICTPNYVAEHMLGSSIPCIYIARPREVWPGKLRPVAGFRNPAGSHQTVKSRNRYAIKLPTFAYLSRHCFELPHLWFGVYNACSSAASEVDALSQGVRAPFLCGMRCAYTYSSFLASG
jgi:hypothetical protein